MNRRSRSVEIYVRNFSSPPPPSILYPHFTSTLMNRDLITGGVSSEAPLLIGQLQERGRTMCAIAMTDLNEMDSFTSSVKSAKNAMSFC